MTKISYIHGIPVNEYAQRGQGIGKLGYVPYLSLTQGEMRLQLLRQRMLLFSRFYPEATEYSQAVAMIDNALTAGVHRGINFIGAIPDELQQVARIISASVDMTRPAASGIIVGRESVMNGVGEIIRTADSTKRLNECIKIVNSNAKYNTNENVRKESLRRCQTLFEIERLYNDYLERVGHHTVYNRLNLNFSFPSRVDTKQLLHNAGIEGMANAAEINQSLVSDWVENGVLIKNSTIGAGLLGSIETSFAISPDPDAQYAQYSHWLTDPKKGKIGVLPAAAIVAIVTAISAVVVAALDFLTKLQQQKAYAMSEARGFGTSAYSADKTDWLTGQTQPPLEPQNDKTLMYAAMGLGAYLLLNDD